MFVFLNFNIFINLHFAHTLRFRSQLSYFCTDPQATVTQGQYPSLSKSHLQYFVRTGCCSSIHFPLLIYSIIQCKCHQEKHDLSLLRQQVCRIPIFFLYIKQEKPPGTVLVLRQGAFCNCLTFGIHRMLCTELL